jgi:hypothetical protein
MFYSENEEGRNKRTVEKIKNSEVNSLKHSVDER